MVNTPPNLDGTMSPGEWGSQCVYSLQLKGLDQNPDDGIPPPADKPMTLIVVRDSLNLYLGFQWNHDPQGANPADGGLGLGFDFNANGVWEDTDHDALGPTSVHTIDDSLLLVYLGVNIGKPQYDANDWIHIYIPHGLYVLSWGDKDDDDQFSWDAIGGPPAEPGTIYNGVEGPVLDGSGNSVAFPYGVGITGTGPYAYTFEIAVPLALFHSPAGFGFELSQKTGPSGDSLAWTWPTIVEPSVDLGNPDTAAVLGKLVGDLANVGGGGILDPGPSQEAVGGAMASVDKVSLVMPWIASLAVLGIVVAVAIRRKRKV
jgi:opacity protein-like surface antigen